MLQQVDGVLLFLPRNRVHDNPSQTLDQRLGRRQPSRLADHQIRGGHVLIHLGGESYDLHDWQGARLPPRGNLIQRRLQRRIFPAHRYDLRRQFRRHQRLQHAARVAGPESASRHQDGGQILMPAVFAAHRPPVFSFGEYWMRRNATDSDRRRGDAQRFQVRASLIRGYEVMIRRRAQPQAVNLEIRDHGDDSRIAPAFPPLAIEQCGRQEMGADGDIGIEGANFLEEARRAGLFHF